MLTNVLCMIVSKRSEARVLKNSYAHILIKHRRGRGQSTIIRIIWTASKVGIESKRITRKTGAEVP